MMSRGVGGSQTPLVVASLWRDTQLATLLRPLIPLSYREDLGEADFLVSKNAAVIFIAEADIISGGGFRRRAVKFRQSSSITAKRRVVVLQKTPLTAQHFSNVQKLHSCWCGWWPVRPRFGATLYASSRRRQGTRTNNCCNPLLLWCPVWGCSGPGHCWHALALCRIWRRLPALPWRRWWAGLLQPLCMSSSMAGHS
ncbi:uncharacterized protein LOC123511297 isoform X2 [Portunus trituberculatus]|uniref:uncharacterized protein LOC123511297 isoform X2 n=1 Tax=Portunus trituberculatus TaxID=210409 RepID=UPI001E1CDD1B|nr:uncharacterized protein LOC123511297 isoform X2 [Portunus trituberculatus]